jgi:hypothetical protein
VTPEPDAGRLSIVWSEEARSDLRRIDRQTALDILHAPTVISPRALAM